MAGEFSDAGAFKALDAVTGRATVTSGSSYLALLTAAPNDATTLSGLAEYSATGYSRQSVTWAAPGLNGASLPETSNSGDLTFGPFTAGTGATVTHCALVSAASGTTGDVLAWWSFDSSRTPATNDSLVISTGNLKLAVD